MAYLSGCSNSLLRNADLAVSSSRKANMGARQTSAMLVRTLTTLNCVRQTRSTKPLTNTIADTLTSRHNRMSFISILVLGKLK